MACPYFYPLEIEGGSTPPAMVPARQDAMLPLGGRWRGMCRAWPEAGVEPDAGMRPVCQLGYARGVCPRFPGGDGPDAVRFTVTRDENGRLSIYYVVERDHHPFAHGRLECQPDGQSPTGAPGEILARQAQAYAESYWRRKGR